ncbi:hypothetical protein, partial [Streptomyces eurythermus]|uniref:hypothetical protein n=1 Tax=Streptomyces eurythermus TaxID=42237 RepID=UPI0033FEE826
IDVLQKIMVEHSAQDIPVGKTGITLEKLAKHELRPGIADRMTVATTYMFPAGDEKRTRIIATLMIAYFIFDGRRASACNLPLRILTHLPPAEKVEETPDGAPVSYLGHTASATKTVPSN